MLTRDFYIATLEKRAAEAAPADSAELAQQQYNATVKDDRAILKEHFDEASAVERQQGQTVGKLFPGNNKGVEKVYGGPLLKVARQIFDECWPQIEEGMLTKTAAPFYREVVFRSFYNELEKLGAAMAPGASRLQRVTEGNLIRQQSAPTYRIGSAPVKETVPPIEQRLIASRAAKSKGFGGKLRSAMGRLGGMFGR